MARIRKRKPKLLRKLKFQTKKVKRIKESRIEKNLVKRGRKEKVKRRRNFFASFLLIILFWLLLVLYIYFVNPDSGLAKLGFFVFEFAVVLFTASFVFTSTRRGILTALFVTFFLVLRMLGVGNVINLLLLSGLVIAIDYYLKN